MGIKSIALVASTLFLSTSVNAAIITLDFTSGLYSDVKGTIDSSTGNPSPGVFDTYTQDGFTLTTQDIGNHIDANAFGNISFHNGPANPVTDNNLILTFSGGSFDLTSIENIFKLGGTTSLELTGSNSSFQSITADGTHMLSLFNVTSVVFSITGVNNLAWDSLTVNTTPSTVPVPAAVWLFGSGLLGLVGIARRRA